MSQTPVTLEAWLDYIKRLHPERISLGLDRVRTVFNSLCPNGLNGTVVTVAGTNGKGSTVAFMESILSAGSYRVGSYTSPHLIRFNERLHINLEELDDKAWCEALADVERVRLDVRLTYFEFVTLAALSIFSKTALDVVLLEVGMGGRLDAVNIIDPDVAIITPIDIDHIAWLGTDRESIAREKAGILRKGKPAICTDESLPESVSQRASELGVSLYRYGKEFTTEKKNQQWDWFCGDVHRSGLPLPVLLGDYQLQNAAGALMALQSLSPHITLDQGAIHEGLLSASLPGRFQVLPGQPLRVLDVAHNPQAGRELAKTLEAQAVSGSTLAIVGMLEDKNVNETLRPLLPLVDQWFCVTPPGDRALNAKELESRLKGLAGPVRTRVFGKPSEAYRQALDKARPQDCILVFGSFYTVSDILQSESNP